MCGIAGHFSFDCQLIGEGPFDLFLDSLTHRGPDGRGIFYSPKEGIALGHRRLSILDTSKAGQQPMRSACGRYRITYNGEIYNFLEIRRELEATYSFRSNSDTEVILAAFAKWGPDALFKFNGMWAFAIWDEREKTLFLSRDRFGVKPLYYLPNERGVLFASETKAFLNQSVYSTDVDDSALAQSIATPNLFEYAQKTILTGVKQIPPGHTLTLHGRGDIKLRPWWRTHEHLVPHEPNFSDRIAHYKELFKSACEIRMRSDVPVATAVSGGMDSSSIFCTLQTLDSASTVRTPKNWKQGFFAYYPNSVQDESEYVDLIEKTYAAKIHRLEVQPAALIDRIDEIIFSFENVWDLPFGPYCLYEQYRKNGVAVSIDGHGGDELFAGYVHTILQTYQNSVKFPPRFGRALEMKAVLSGMTEEHPEIPIPNLVQLISRYYAKPAWRKVKDLIKSVIGYSNSASPGYFHSPVPALQAPSESTGTLRGLNRSLYNDFHFVTLPTILRNFDRLGMAHGVEIRAPFLDWRVVCYAMGLPEADKVNEGYTRWIHRQAMDGIVPDGIRLRKPKTGFSSPLHEYLSGPMKPYFMDILMSQGFRECAIFNGPKIIKEVETAYRQNEPSQVSAFWNYVHAYRLRELFQQRRLLKLKAAS